jgi:DNA-binding CsgD family transcriptional regulator
MSSVYGPMPPIRKARICELWRQGYRMSFIPDDIAKPPATVYSYLLYHGGMEPRSRVRRLTSLTIEERETISRGLANHQILRSIALELGRSASTVSREVARNGGTERYRANLEEKAAFKRARRPKPLLLGINVALRNMVAQVGDSNLAINSSSTATLP